MSWQVATPIVLGFLTLVGALVGAYLGYRGKLSEVNQMKAAQLANTKDQQFDQVVSVAGLRLVEIERLAAARDAAEEKNTKLIAEWEGRWARQMERCRRITDAATDTIANLQKQVINPLARRDATRTLIEIEDHRASDHPEIGETDA
jgi:hypothetical protein